jgi:hypothetical protein
LLAWVTPDARSGIYQTKPSAITTEPLERIAARHKVEDTIRGNPPSAATPGQTASTPPLALGVRMIEIRAKPICRERDGVETAR